MTPAELSINLMTDKQCISSASLAFGNIVRKHSLRISQDGSARSDS